MAMYLGSNKVEIGAVASGSGGGNTATVTATYKLNGNTITPNNFDTSGSISIINSNNERMSDFYYDATYGLPISDLGTPSLINVPLYMQYASNIGEITFMYNGGLLTIDAYDSHVISGDATISDAFILVTGNCSIEIALAYAD